MPETPPKKVLPMEDDDTTKNRWSEKTTPTSPATPESALFRFGLGKGEGQRRRSSTPLAPPPTREEDKEEILGVERVFCAHNRFLSSSSKSFTSCDKSENDDDRNDDDDDDESDDDEGEDFDVVVDPAAAPEMMDDDENDDRRLLRKAQKRLEMQQRSRLTLVQRRLAEADARARKQRNARERVAVTLHEDQKKLKRANDRAMEAERRADATARRREKEEKMAEKERERCERLREEEREEMEKSETLRRELDKTARERREKEEEVLNAETMCERTMRETAQGERVASMNERVVWEREERVENMMETERKLREKTETLERRSEQARKETEEMKRENEEKATEIEKQRKENAALREKWALTVKTCEKTDEEARRLFEETGAAKREDAKVKLEISAELKEIASARREMKTFESDREKLLVDMKKNEDLISACSITSEQHAKETNEDRKEVDSLVATAATLRLRALEVSREIERVNQEREKLREKQHALEDEIISKLSNEIAAKTERTKFDSKSIEELKKQTRDVESTTVRCQNLKAMADVEKLDIESETLDTEREIEEIEIEIQSMALEGETKEARIKSGRRELEKLAMERDALDKRAERIKDRILAAERVKASYSENSSTNETTGGPLNATLASLRKELAATRKESDQSRQNWLQAQNELLRLMESEKLTASSLQELQSDERLYEGKMNRHKRDAKVYERDALDINREIDRLRRKLSMLNEEVSLSDKILESAPEEFKVLKQTLQKTLDDAKRELTSAENKLTREKRDVAKEKARIEELREEVLKWNHEREKEIETQNALDPYVGNVELLRAREEVHALEKQLDKAKRSKEAMAANLETKLKKRDILANSANDRVFVVGNAMHEARESNDKDANNNFEDGGNNKPNDTVDESYASINADVFDDIVLYEDPNDDDIANEIKRKRNEEILANRRRKHERIAQREIREALKKAAVSNENADLLECKAKELKASCDVARASAKMAMQEIQRLKIETGAAQRRAEAHVIDTARSQRARKMLESAADKIRYEDEDDEDGNDKRAEKNHQYSRVSECDQLLSNEQSASDKLREVENERERLSRLLRHAWEREKEEEEEGEDRESDDDEDAKLRRSINRAQHLLESRHQISFAASYVHDAIDKQKSKLRDRAEK